MKRIEVTKKGDQWVGTTGNKVVSSGKTKGDGVRAAAAAAKSDPAAVSVRIHKENGQFQEERTYPRKADPRRSRG